MAMSGTMRWPGLAMATPPTVPDCQLGWVVKMLTPPPPAERGAHPLPVQPADAAPAATSSFQTISGM